MCAGPAAPAQEVQRIGVVTEKNSPDFIMVVHLVSPDERYDMLYLSNFAHLRVRDELLRIRRRRQRAGVRRRRVQHARGWIRTGWPRQAHGQRRRARDPRAERAGRGRRAGRPPAPTDTSFQVSVNARGRLANEEEFADIVVRATPDGRITRIRDVGRVELGANLYALRSLLDNQPAVAIGIFQRPGTNAIEASNQVRETMAALQKSFPKGSNTASSTTRRSSSASRSRPSSRRSRPSCWSRWSS